jgi:hypothetical protein
MGSFCCNQECELYKYEVDRWIHYIDIITEYGLSSRRIERHAYIKKGGTVLYLCSICHAAIEMVREQ